MPEQNLDSRRIAKNTIILYVRMIVLMLISLYTSRVVLHLLGEDDYGIYNVVGGVIAMFSMLSQTLSTAISRFLTFELGKGDIGKLRRIFSSSLIIQMFMSVIIILLAETIAVWFLNNRMNIPLERMDAARWVLQCALLIFIINLVNVPYNASVIAHEKMDTFAYIAVLEGVLKLVVAFLLAVSSYDKLKVYAVLLLIVDIATKSIYFFYCRRHFAECKFKFAFDKSLIKQIGSFAGWNLLGNGAWILSTHGVNVLTNVFFPVKVNAARGIAMQVNSAIQNFSSNFSMALNPQITKSYAMGNVSYMHDLVIRGAKFSFFLYLFFALPICMETEKILDIWLHKVPEFAVIFVRLSIIGTIFTVLAETLIKAMFATGKIKKYQIIVGIIALLDIVITYFAYKSGCSPTIAYVIFIAIYFILTFVRLYIVKDLIELKAKRYLKEVLLKVTIVSLASMLLPLLFIINKEASLLRLLETTILCFISTGLSVDYIGMDRKEREFIVKKIRTKLRKNHA